MTKLIESPTYRFTRRCYAVEISKGSNVADLAKLLARMPPDAKFTGVRDDVDVGPGIVVLEYTVEKITGSK